MMNQGSGEQASVVMKFTQVCIYPKYIQSIYVHILVHTLIVNCYKKLWKDPPCY